MRTSLALRGLVGLLIPVLGFLWLSEHKSAIVEIDGQMQEVSTHAETVGELLERTGTEVGEHDRLTPEADAPLVDGMVVELVRAREVTLLLEGVEQQLVVTVLSVDELVDEVDGVARRDTVKPSRLSRVTDGMTVEVRSPVTVNVLADGREHEVVTDAETVEEVLERLGIDLGEEDRVDPDVGEEPPEDGEIVVERIGTRTEEREITVDYDTLTRADDDLEPGEEREVQEGQEGLERVVEEITVIDGEEIERVELAREVVREVRDRVVAVGPGEPEPTATPTPTETADPVETEAPTPAATEAPHEHSQTGNATYYHTMFDGRQTANGEIFDPHAMTAAHRTLPFGTMVTVTNRNNGKSVQVRINDRGPYAEGNIIDLSRAAFDKIGARSTGVLPVRIEW